MTGDISIKGAYVGSYIGNNALTKTLNFNFEPAYLMLFMVQTNAGTAQNYMCGIQGMKYPFPNNNGTYVSFTWNSKSVIITATSSFILVYSIITVILIIIQQFLNLIIKGGF